MSLYDIIEEINDRQITKTETGDTRIIGVMVGIVAKNYHPSMGGRVCVTIPTRDETANELQWARVAMPSSGKKWGHYFLPEIGDQVLLAFEGGNIERPYVIGCLPMDNNSFLTGSVDSGNQYKRIVTKHGSSLTFEDSTIASDGSQDKITLSTAQEKHTVCLDNAMSKISITDKDGNNKIEINTMSGNGAMTIKAANSLTIQVGSTIKITMNGDSGAVKISAQQVTIEASNKVGLSSDGMVQIEGAQVMEKASAMYKQESGGMLTISGTPIRLG